MQRSADELALTGMQLRLLIPILVVGCAADHDGSTDLLVDLPPAPLPGAGWRILTPIVEGIQPGADLEICTWTDVVTTTATDVKVLTGFQTEPPGHHVVAYYTTETQPPGTQRICNDHDMSSFRFLAAALGEGSPSAAPGNLVWRIPQGAQIVINHHYLNAADQIMRGRAALDVDFAAPGQSYVTSSSASLVDGALVVPKGAATDDIHCTIQNTLRFWYLIPHMHQWGKHIDVDVTRSGSTTRLFDQDWEPSFAFHPPQDLHDPSAPLVLSPGDSVDIHCTWNNDSGMALPFGFEMCVVFGQFIDDQKLGNLACDRGHWGGF